MLSTLSHVTIQCTDGLYKLSYGLATISKVLLTVLVKYRSTKPIPVLLSKKHFQYLEFYFVHGFVPSLHIDQLYVYWIEYKGGHYPKQSLEDQLIMLEAMYFLEIPDHLYGHYIDSTLDNDFYTDQGITGEQVNQFAEKWYLKNNPLYKKKNNKLPWKLTRYSTHTMLEVITLFKKNEKDLSNYIATFE